MSDFSGILAECLQDMFFWRGFVAGVVILFLVWCIVRLILSCRRQVKSIVVCEDGGQFVVSRKAFREFLRGVVNDIPGAELLDVSLVKRRGGKVRVNLNLSLAPNGDLNAVHGTLRQRVLEEAQQKLGIGDRIESVNMLFSKMPSSDQVKSAGSVSGESVR